MLSTQIHSYNSRFSGLPVIFILNIRTNNLKRSFSRFRALECGVAYPNFFEPPSNKNLKLKAFFAWAKDTSVDKCKSNEAEIRPILVLRSRENSTNFREVKRNFASTDWSKNSHWPNFDKAVFRWQWKQRQTGCNEYLFIGSLRVLQLLKAKFSNWKVKYVGDR